MAKNLSFIGVWMLIFVMTLLGYSYRNNLTVYYYRVLGQLVPGMAVPLTPGAVAINRDDSGHFHVTALVNGVQIYFLIDTGASQVALTAADATKLGINVNALTYDVPISTAGGTSYVAGIPKVSVQIGDIVIQGASATVSHAQDLDSSLLGMSFLSQLASFSVEGDRMILQALSTPEKVTASVP